jgi:hypothetical protein
MTKGVGVKNKKITVEVGVGVGVSVFRVGVIVRVGVAEGSNAAVWVAAAWAVWTMKVLIAPGSMVGTDWVVSDGTQAMISVRARIQVNNFVFGVIAMSSSCTSRQSQSIKDYGFTTSMVV